MERYLRVNLLGPGPRLMKKRIYRAAVSRRLRNTDVDNMRFFVTMQKRAYKSSRIRNYLHTRGRVSVDFQDYATVRGNECKQVAL